MTTTTPRKSSSSATYKTARKKIRLREVTRKEWARIQQLQLPKFRKLKYQEWPLDKILDERRNEGRLEYLVKWEAHPITGELWQDSWCEADQVGQAAIDEWEATGTQNTSKSDPQSWDDNADGPSLKGRARATRTLPNSSSGQEQTQTQAPDGPQPVSSSVEIAETQPDTNHPPLISVNIPPNNINRDDYESVYNSSQLFPKDPSQDAQRQKPLSSRASPLGSISSYHSATQTPILTSSTSSINGARQLRSNSSASSFDVNAEYVLDSIERANSSSSAIPMDSSTDAVVFEPAIASSIGPQAPIYDVALGGSALPIQDSIEEEDLTTTASSSQNSAENERTVPQQAGLVVPSFPELGTAEYALALPCEGKVQSIYLDIIKAKEKQILKFISRHESIGSASSSPNRTHERNEMYGLIDRLHDIVTHMDLGLPGPSTQYVIDSQEHAKYAAYAGSKFSFLGHLVDVLNQVGLSICIVCREGVTQDLIENYLKMKKVVVKRQDRMAKEKSPTPDRLNTDFQVEIVASQTSHEVRMTFKPVLMIAFDASFDAQDPQIKRIRSHFSPQRPRLMPVLHLLVRNSSEHVARCLPNNIPSPLRLKALVRYTYSARGQLGGEITVNQAHLGNEPRLDFTAYQKLVRMAPDRRLEALAKSVMQACLAPDFGTKWDILMPELDLADIIETPPRPSGRTTRAETPRDMSARSRTPVSRADTPSRKRHLDVDGILPALTKRQRLTPTPMRDLHDRGSTPSIQHESHQRHVRELKAELEKERAERRRIEQEYEKEKTALQAKADEWRGAHDQVLARYEKRMKKTHALDREKTALLKATEAAKTRHENLLEQNVALRQRNKDLQSELDTARNEMKAGGGDLALLETARDEVRTAQARATVLEKSLENTRKDFEFTREQYQIASNKAAELAAQVTDLEKVNTSLAKQATGERVKLKELNIHSSARQQKDHIEKLELEVRARESLLKKFEEDNRRLKQTRGGVQTRGSSVQPPGSPGLTDAFPVARGTRSRHGSPAPGHVGAGGGSTANRPSNLRREG
jgi:hypothetical protein